MFVYKLRGGLTITISLPTLSIIFPKTAFGTPFESLSKKDQLRLTEAEKDCNIEHFRDRSRVEHDWCHPPALSKRYEVLYKPKYLGVVPFIGDDAAHYHFLSKDSNPIQSIFKFLHFLSILTEEGDPLCLSLKDLADLKWQYQSYLKLFTLERFSEAVGAYAIKLLRTSTEKEARKTISSLKKLRSVIEQNIGITPPNIEMIKNAMDAIPRGSNSDELTSILQQGEKLLAELSLGNTNYKIEELDSNTTTLLQSGFFQAKKRTDCRITNLDIVLLSTLGLLAVDISKQELSPITCDMMGLYLLFGLSTLSEQEPRYLIKTAKKSMYTLFSKVSEDLGFSSTPDIEDSSRRELQPS